MKEYTVRQTDEGPESCTRVYDSRRPTDADVEEMMAVREMDALKLLKCWIEQDARNGPSDASLRRPVTFRYINENLIDHGDNARSSDRSAKLHEPRRAACSGLHQ